MKRVNAKLAQLRKKVRLTSHECYSSACNNLAIRTHILQKNRILRNVAENSKVVQLTDLDPRQNHGTKYRFKITGIKDKRSDVLTYWGFCNQCDNSIFAPIEQVDEFDYDSYQTHILFSYRGFLSEFYKQEYNLKWYELIFKSKEIPQNIKNIYRDLYVQFSLIVKDGLYFKDLLQSEIESNFTRQYFTFKKIVLPKYDLFSSTVYAHPRKLSFSSRDNAEKYIAQLNPSNKYYSPHGIPIFFNLIPEKETLIGIIGWSNKDIHGLDLEEVNIDFLNSKLAEKFISDVLIKRVETWGLSISLWRNWKELGVDKKVIELIHKYLPPEMKSEKVDFNLFA